MVPDEYISNRAVFDLVMETRRELLSALSKHEDSEMEELAEVKRDVKSLQQWKWRATGIMSVIVFLAPFAGIILNKQIGN